MAKMIKRFIGGKHLIIISSIAALNMMGMSYAYWNDQLEIVTKLSTGYMKPLFDKNNSYVTIEKVSDLEDCGDDKNNWGDNEYRKDEGKLNNVDVEIEDKGKTMIISGQLEEGYQAIVHYSVLNQGTIPVKSVKNDETITKNGLNIQLNQPSKIIKPLEKHNKEDKGVNALIEIKPTEMSDSQDRHKLIKPDDHADKKNTVKFGFDLLFKQWTVQDSSHGGYTDEE
jgi:hypothetical protein